MNKAKIKFPDAQFIATLDLMINLTQEFVLDHNNFTAETNYYVTQMLKIHKLMSENSTITSGRLEELNSTKKAIEKHSFLEIGQRFKSINYVLKMIYEK